MVANAVTAEKYSMRAFAPVQLDILLNFKIVGITGRIEMLSNGLKEVKSPEVCNE